MRKSIKFNNYRIAFDIDNVVAMDYNKNDSIFAIVTKEKDFLIGCSEETANKVIDNYINNNNENEEYEDELKPQASTMSFLSELAKEETKNETKTTPKFLNRG